MKIIALWPRLAPIYNQVRVPALVAPQAAPLAAVRVVQARALLPIPTNQAVKSKVKRRRSKRQSRLRK